MTLSLWLFGFLVVADSAIVYQHAPDTVLDPRIFARIGNQTFYLEVEDAPSKPQTRDPGFGRPPFTSSRLRLASSTPVRVSLQCISRTGTSPCYFDNAITLLGVGFDGDVERSADGRELRFVLPPPSENQLAAHFYLETTVHNAAGSSHFSRGTLFYFWIDSDETTPAPRVNITTLGVIANSTKIQTETIQQLLDTFILPAGHRLYFPGPALYRTEELILRRSIAIELGEGVKLQHPAPSLLHARKVNRQTLRQSPPPKGNCSERAFITISATSGVFIGGRGGTIDTNGFAGNSICIADSSNVTLHHILLRGSASWSTHIFRSSHVQAEGIKIFSGADGFDPDNSQDVSLRSIFVHSNDDSIAVKATMPGINTERITCQHALLSTKKSCLKVGTESLSDFDTVLFADIEGFKLDRGMVLYPSDGGTFANIKWQNVRFSSFYPYSDEGKTGAIFDFETKHRHGLSQLVNITASNITVSTVISSSMFKGVAGADIQSVTLRNISLTVGRPIKHLSTANNIPPKFKMLSQRLSGPEATLKTEQTLDLSSSNDDHADDIPHALSHHRHNPTREISREKSRSIHTTHDRSSKPYVFDCHEHVLPITTEGVHVNWGDFKDEWGGLQNSDKCLLLD